MKFLPYRNIPSRIAGQLLKEGEPVDIDADVAKKLEEMGLGAATADQRKPKRKATSDSTESKKSEEPKQKSGD